MDLQKGENLAYLPLLCCDCTFFVCFCFLMSEFMEETTKTETIKSSSWIATYAGSILMLITTQNVAVIDLNIFFFCALIQKV